jgi:hypothetical protein
MAESLRAAIEQTFERAAEAARSGPTVTRERAGDLLDEVVRRGRDTRDEVVRRGQGAREELGRRGQEAREGLTRRGQDARGELARRLELLEERLTELEKGLRRESRPEPED